MFGAEVASAVLAFEGHEDFFLAFLAFHVVARFLWL
jgi:hypothetical protein